MNSAISGHLVTKELSQPIEEPPPPGRQAPALMRYNRRDREAPAEIIRGVKAQHLRKPGGAAHGPPGLEGAGGGVPKRIQRARSPADA